MPKTPKELQRCRNARMARRSPLRPVADRVAYGEPPSALAAPFVTEGRRAVLLT